MRIAARGEPDREGPIWRRDRPARVGDPGGAVAGDGDGAGGVAAEAVFGTGAGAGARCASGAGRARAAPGPVGRAEGRVASRVLFRAPHCSGQRCCSQKMAASTSAGTRSRTRTSIGTSAWAGEKTFRRSRE